MRTLSEAYKPFINGTARCPNCGEEFINDLPLYGSLLCPNDMCRVEGWAMEMIPRPKENHPGVPKP